MFEQNVGSHVDVKIHGSNSSHPHSHTYQARTIQSISDDRSTYFRSLVPPLK